MSLLDARKNFAKVTVSTGYNDTDTSIVLSTGDGAKLPNPSTDGEFNLTWWNWTDYKDPSDDPNKEIVRCTARSTDTLTITRAQEGTSATVKNISGKTYLMILSPTKKTIDDIETKLDQIDYADSPMIVSGGEISNGTNAGTIKVAALTALLRSTDSLTGSLVKVTKSEEDNIAIPTADTIYHVSLNYNGGSPTISLTTSSPYDSDKRNIPIGKAYKDTSDNVHYTSCGFRLQDGVRKLHKRAQELRAIKLESGSNIAYSGTNNFTMTEGVVYSGINRFSLSAYDSATTAFTPVYQNGSGGWTYDTDRNTIDYNHYDDGDGTLGEVANNKYSCHWVYRHIDDGHVYVLYGRGSYTLAEAELTKEPTRPDLLTDFGCLIGKIIAPQTGGSFTEVQMVTDTFFVGTNTSNHNYLGGLQGGTASEYYHLTNTQHTDLTDAGDSTLHYHAADRDRANHTGTQTASTISDFDTEVSNNTDVAANTSARHTQNTDTALGAQSQDLDMNTHKIVNVVDPTANQDAATKKYVDDNSINNIVEDTTPQLGGQLDVNGQSIGDGTLELLKFSETASAVNEITIKNADTNNPPEIQATGDDTNIDLKLVPKGTGRVTGVYRYIEIRLLDKDTSITTGTGVGGEFRVPRAMTVKNVGAYIDTASTSGLPTIDINEDGASILSTKITIDVNEKTSQTATTAPVISDSSIAADAILTFDVDVAGTGAKGLVVWMEVVM